MSKFLSVQLRTGQVRTHQVRAVEVRAGRVRAGPVRTDQVRTGQVRTSQVRTGQVMTGPKIFLELKLFRTLHFIGLKMHLRMEFDSGVGPTCLFDSQSD